MAVKTPSGGVSRNPVGSGKVAAEFRNQFNGLKDLIDNLPGSPAMLDILPAHTAGSLLSVDYLNLTVSNPPTQSDLQAVRRQD